MMDWLPIMLLCLSAGFYFVAQSTRWYYAVVTVLGYLVLMFALRNWLLADNMSLFINVNYAIMASFVLFSVLSYLIYTQWKAGKWVGFALLSFVLALTFRIADKWDWFSFGTHFCGILSGRQRRFVCLIISVLRRIQSEKHKFWSFIDHAWNHF